MLHQVRESGGTDSIREADAEEDGEAIVESISGLLMFPRVCTRLWPMWTLTNLKRLRSYYKKYSVVYHLTIFSSSSLKGH